MTPEKRDLLGRRVREVWVQWAMRQSAPKASWLHPYDELDEADKEADRCIGEALWADGYSTGYHDGYREGDLDGASNPWC